MGKRLGLAVLAASLAGGAAHATPYPAIYSFGDSLSDVGNVFNFTAGTYPIPGVYFVGRFTNGQNWLEGLGSKLGLSVSPSFVLFPPSGNDFAWGGAQTGTTIASGDSLIPSLDNEVDLQFKKLEPSPTPGALYTLEIGGNDIFNAVSALKSGSISLNDMKTTFLNQMVTNTVDAIKDLYGDGMRSLLYYETPDLAAVPEYVALGSSFAADAGALANDFNTDVLNGVHALNLAGLTVFDVPTFSSLDKIVKNPSAYGFTDVTDPCYSGSFDTSGTVCANPDQHLFWDSEHPTKIAQALAGELAFDVLTGTTGPLTAPEPSTWAMMLIGFAGLSFAGWRTRRAGALA